jgi:hypothetical protein
MQGSDRPASGVRCDYEQRNEGFLRGLEVCLQKYPLSQLTFDFNHASIKNGVRLSYEGGDGNL